MVIFFVTFFTCVMIVFWVTNTANEQKYGSSRVFAHEKGRHEAALTMEAICCHRVRSEMFSKAASVVSTENQ
jgi:hypothetical protein